MCKAFWMNWGVPWKKAIPADHHGAHLGAQETIPCESPVGVQSPSCFCQAVSIPWPSLNLHHSVPWVNWTNLTVCFFPAYPSHHKRPITPSSFFIPWVSILIWPHQLPFLTPSHGPWNTRSITNSISEPQYHPDLTKAWPPLTPAQWFPSSPLQQWLLCL
jgi:hypothetical protein